MKASKVSSLTMNLPFLVLIGISIATVLLFFHFSTEDSYITYRYARNLIEGNGFVYNYGEKFLSTTAPFYAFLLALAGLAGLDIPTAGGILSTLSLGLAVLMLYLLTLKRGYPLVGVLCGLFMYLNPWFLQTFGSETYFHLFLIISAFYFYDQNKYELSSVFCALAFLTRPDGIIPGLILFIDYIIHNKKFPTRECLVFVVLCLPFLFFNRIYFGAFLPSTLSAKQAQYASGLWYKFWPGTIQFAKLTIFKESRLFYLILPLSIIGCLALIFSRRIWILIGAWAVLHTLGYLLLKVSFYHWYAIPLIFLVALAGAFSVRSISFAPCLIHEDISRSWKFWIVSLDMKISLTRLKKVRAFAASARWLVSAFIITSVLLVLFSGTRAYIKTRQSLPFPKLQLYTKAGQWVSQNTPPEASVAFLEVGYFGYHAERKVIDLVGVVTPGVSEHIRRGDFQWAVQNFQPDYFFYNEEFKGWLKPVIEQPWFQNSYVQILELAQKGYPFRLIIFKKR